MGGWQRVTGRGFVGRRVNSGIPVACLICTSTGLIDNSREAGKAGSLLGSTALTCRTIGVRPMPSVSAGFTLMEYARLGYTGLQVSHLAQGCMTYGTPTDRRSPPAGRALSAPPGAGLLSLRLGRAVNGRKHVRPYC
jgi:hypothetical protein